MTPFLDRLVSEIPVNAGPETLILFPSQRAANRFRHLFAKRKAQAGFLPQIRSIGEWVGQVSPLPVPPQSVQLLELFKAYRRFNEKATFSSFAGWGKVCLDDFNEIDLQLIHPEKLFSEVRTLNELDEKFSPDAEDFEALAGFWQDIGGENHGLLSSRFLDYWKQLYPLYADFHAAMHAEGYTTQGNIWRKLAEDPGLPTVYNDLSSVYYAGFYAFNRSEQRLLEKTRELLEVRLFVDGDNFYIENKSHKAGHFFRQGFLNDQQVNWRESYFSQNERKVEVIGCQGQTGMWNELIHRLIQLESGNQAAENQTCVILPDSESLSSFTRLCADFNLKVSSASGINVSRMSWYKDLQQLSLVHIRHSKNHSDTAHSSALLGFFSEEVRNTIPQQEEYWHASDCIHYFLKSIPDSENLNIQAFRHACNRVLTQLQPYHSLLEPESFWPVFFSELSKTVVPLESSTPGGVEVMGLLESRCLDFENVFIVSVNEGVYPDSGWEASLIPPILKKYHSLSGKTESEAVQSYHFHRLLQRASAVCLLYDSRNVTIGSAEMSRYIRQLEAEWPACNQNVRFEFRQVSPVLPDPTAPTIRIQKSQELYDKLVADYALSGDDSQQKTFSPTRLSEFISCPLKFYFRYILELKEPEDKSELDAAKMGLIVHRTLELLYTGLVDMDSANISKLKAALPKVFDKALTEILGKKPSYGYEVLLMDVLKRLVLRVIEKDAEAVPFKIHSLEKSFTTDLTLTNGIRVRIKGTVDRIDEKDGEIRIIDYKTGKILLTKKNDYAELVSGKRKKHALQLAIYSLLYHHNHPGSPFKAYLLDVKDRAKLHLLELCQDENFTTRFEVELKALLERIFDRSEDFFQTDDFSTCTLCAYRHYCQR